MRIADWDAAIPGTPDSPEKSPDKPIVHWHKDVMESHTNRGKQSELLNAINLLIVVGACGIACYALSKGDAPPRMVFRILAVSIGIAGASLMFGGLFGFLFSIPRAGTDDQSAAYRDNSNLVDISDWLTKILVGAGLVTLTKIPPKLEMLATYWEIVVSETKRMDPSSPWCCWC